MEIQSILRKIIRKIKSKYKQKSTDDVLQGFGFLGNNVKIHGNFRCQFKERIDIGDYVYVGENASFNGRGQVSIGRFSILSSDVTILSSQHHYKNASLLPYDEIEELSKVTIGECCWVGMKVIILPGVNIGDGCIIGAGAVVTKSIPKCSIIAGNPAKIVGNRDEDEYDRLYKNGKFYLLEKDQYDLQKIEQVILPKPNFY